MLNPAFLFHEKDAQANEGRADEGLNPPSSVFNPLKTAFDAGKTALNFLAHTASLSPTHSTLKVGA